MECWRTFNNFKNGPVIRRPWAAAFFRERRYGSGLNQRAEERALSHDLRPDLESRRLLFRFTPRSRAFLSTRHVATVVLSCLLFFNEHSLAQLDLSRELFVHGAKNLRIPLGKSSSEPSAFLNIGEIGLEQRRLGPLRLGLLQKLVLRNVVVEIPIKSGNSVWPYDLSAFLENDQALYSSILDRFTLETSDLKTRVSAALASYSPDRKLLLLEKVKVVVSTNPPRLYPKAGLLLSGPEAGSLVLSHAGGVDKLVMVPEKQ